MKIVFGVYVLKDDMWKIIKIYEEKYQAETKKNKLQNLGYHTKIEKLCTP